MDKKLLLNVLGGVLFVNGYNVGNATTVLPPPHSRNEDRRSLVHSSNKGENRVKKEDKKPRRSQSEEPKGEPLEERPEIPQEVDIPPPAQRPSAVPVICNERVLGVYKSNERVTGLWMQMINLKRGTVRRNNWYGSEGIRNLVWHLAKMYAETQDQDIKDAIALYFVDTSERYAGELAGGDDDEAEQEAIDFVNRCLELGDRQAQA